MSSFRLGSEYCTPFWVARSAICSKHAQGVPSGAEASLECCDGQTNGSPKNVHVLIPETFE